MKHAYAGGDPHKQCLMCKACDPKTAECPGVAVPTRATGNNMLFVVGEAVYKIGGDYRFSGIIVAAFYKRHHAGSRQHERYVVENDDGLCFIFNGMALHRVIQG